MADFISYDNDTFKCIDCIPEYCEYHTIYVAKRPDTEAHAKELIAKAHPRKATKERMSNIE